ncbi:hypothetical protein KVH17_17680 [Streptomyces olivaceus]|nr:MULTISPECIES: hypothetical protein [Streptomyces]MBZ6201537.1 hypothetical protein [Streptomyces olivaceus]MCC2267418.1 hypothetical protein [Streptomyces sp. CT1-17]
MTVPHHRTRARDHRDRHRAGDRRPHGTGPGTRHQPPHQYQHQHSEEYRP